LNSKALNLFSHINAPHNSFAIVKLEITPKFTDGIAVIYCFASMEGSTPLTIISDFESIEESRGASIFEAL
jgi:hypothetical protein